MNITENIKKYTQVLYETKETLSSHHYASIFDAEYPTQNDFEEIRRVIEKLQSLLPSDLNVQGSDTTDDASSNQS